LPTSFDTTLLSCVYPPDHMTVIQSPQVDGWYYGNIGSRFVWLPEDVGRVWLARGKEPSQSCYLVLGGNTDKITILDMKDYVNSPAVGGLEQK
jgi:hypothetical protein